MQRCIWAKSPEAPTGLHSTGTVQITPQSGSEEQEHLYPCTGLPVGTPGGCKFPGAASSPCAPSPPCAQVQWTPAPRREAEVALGDAHGHMGGVLTWSLM